MVDNRMVLLIPQDGDGESRGNTKTKPKNKKIKVGKGAIENGALTLRGSLDRLSSTGP
jgi:hypothetical protein